MSWGIGVFYRYLLAIWGILWVCIFRKCTVLCLMVANLSLCLDWLGTGYRVMPKGFGECYNWYLRRSRFFRESPPSFILSLLCTSLFCEWFMCNYLCQSVNSQSFNCVTFVCVAHSVLIEGCD